LSNSTDHELVDAYLNAREDSAFMQLVQRYQIPVYRHLTHELADPDDAETVCEAVFTVAGKRLREWSKESEFRDWLLQVATEVGASRRGTAVGEDSPRLVDPAVFFRQSVHKALQSLEPQARSLLIGVELDGKSIETVAEENDLSLDSATESLAVARAEFTETLSAPARASTDPKRPTYRVEPGEVIDNRYRIERLLGEGGMATVFRAEHMGIKRTVAVKTLRPSRQAQEMVRERFVREAEVLGKLAHPNFVDISDFGESSQGFAYLVMELLDGRPLSEELRDAGRLAPLRALKLIAEVAKGLEFAHANGIIHRDIKPDNVVVLYDSESPHLAKILDLGVAATSDELETPQTALFGTPAYMAPEQVKGGRIDARVDIYSTGIMLFELLTGEVPYRGSTPEFTLVQQISEPIPSLKDFDVKFPRENELDALVQRCLAKDPASRVPSALVLQQEVESLIALLETDGEVAGIPSPGVPLAPAESMPPESKTRLPRFRWSLVFGLLATIALVSWLLAQQ